MTIAPDLDALAAQLPAGSVATDPAVLAAHRRDAAPYLPADFPAGTPRAVVRPAGTDDVRTTLRWASAYGVPVVPRGAGSGLSGGATAVEGALVVTFERMDRIRQLDPAAMLAVVQPGVLTGALQAAARWYGLVYPPDPASAGWSTVGGNVATNAGGLCCVKYGVTGDYVLGLEVVLADGSVLRTGGRTVKNVAGYDLTSLLVGSEGTLGVITEVTLRLRPAPPPGTTLVATLPSLGAAGRAVEAIVARTRPSLLELLDRTTVTAIEAFRPMGLDTSAAALLLARSDAGGDVGRGEIAAIAAACRAAGATRVVDTDDEAEGERLLAARRLAYPALERLGTVVVDDVAVPVPLLPRMIALIEEIAVRERVTVATVGHAGDGNLHPLVAFDPAQAGEEARAVAAYEAIASAAVALGGTVTGEHGVGVLKRGFLTEQLGVVSVQLQRRLKAVFDPLGILNPGKVLP